MLVPTILNSVGKSLLFRVLKVFFYYERIRLATHKPLGSSRFLLALSATLPLSRRNLDRSQEKCSTILGGRAFSARSKML